jgi:ketosteroid isomerase-like protein
MNAIRLHLMPTVFALATFSAMPVQAGADEDAIARNLEAFRSAQVASNGPALIALTAPELSYSHSDGHVEDRTTFVSNATSGKSTFLSLAYRNPTIRVVGNTAIVRFNWVGEQQAVADGTKAATNLHILMIWQKQGDEWRLLARGATKL